MTGRSPFFLLHATVQDYGPTTGWWAKSTSLWRVLRHMGLIATGTKLAAVRRRGALARP